MAQDQPVYIDPKAITHIFLVVGMNTLDSQVDRAGLLWAVYESRNPEMYEAIRKLGTGQDIKTYLAQSPHMDPETGNIDPKSP